MKTLQRVVLVSSLIVASSAFAGLEPLPCFQTPEGNNDCSSGDNLSGGGGGTGDGAGAYSDGMGGSVIAGRPKSTAPTPKKKQNPKKDEKKKEDSKDSSEGSKTWIDIADRVLDIIEQKEVDIEVPGGHVKIKNKKPQVEAADP